MGCPVDDQRASAAKKLDSESCGLEERVVRRYSRQVVVKEIGVSGQEKLCRSRVMVVGAGGLGSPVLMYLAAAGVERIGVSEFDSVEESNLNRQLLYGEDGIGREKAEVLREKLAKMNSRLTVDVHGKIERERLWTDLEGYDMVVDCTDSREARYLLNDYCAIRGITFVCGSSLRWEGAVYSFKGDSCYRCLYPRWSKEELPSCASRGVVGAVCGVVGSLMAAEVLKEISGAGREESVMVSMNVLTNEYLRVQIKGRTRQCVMCSNKRSVTKKQLLERMGYEQLTDVEEHKENEEDRENKRKEVLEREEEERRGKEAGQADTKNYKEGGEEERETESGNGRRLAWDEILENRDKYLLVDVRSREEHHISSLKGSELYSLSAIIKDTKTAFFYFRRREKESNRKIVLFCRYGKTTEKFSVLFGLHDAMGGIEEYKRRMDNDFLLL